MLALWTFWMGASGTARRQSSRPSRRSIAMVKRRSCSTAVRKRRSPARTGEESPGGMGVFHTRLAGPISTGGLEFSATPEPPGPRNWVQFVSSAIVRSGPRKSMSTTARETRVITTKSSPPWGGNQADSWSSFREVPSGRFFPLSPGCVSVAVLPRRGHCQSATPQQPDFDAGSSAVLS